MRPKHLLISTALVIPAMLLPLASCSDSSRNPAEPSTPNAPQVQSQSVAPRGGGAFNIAQAKGSLSQAIGLARRMSGFTTMTTGPRAKHDPTIEGLPVNCVDGVDFGYPSGTSDPFRSFHETGCEMNTLAGGAAITLPKVNSTRGRRVANISRLEFYYAGGPQNGGAPRFSLFTDYCETQPTVTTLTTGRISCGPGKFTDGDWDETLFIDVNGCNDGDVYVGAVLLKTRPTSASDQTCQIFEAYGKDQISGTGDEKVYNNWADYVAQNPNDRMAANFGKSNDFARADNFIIADVPVHYLVYRVKMN
jgi:hypothetical protein